ncbi:3'(2'),5'-bisphosphate nucleotidase CysQ [Rhizobium sp. SSA_523]|uniref:3'(2'),5'-bisphosphate nucleotidase CysQ n=1 Tax=Rhizobium sp. SSA_523 TaxID=2952477 RepID=UPI002090E431|nr:3'(2'),5'-bisphosphate nucleotidase CysQ [Rhizobium sp. SSA_523]MCO5732585.1 3'(2'),5'-bisphosphate nucleotidase CysQ [Rhizobium sp. SSA_523]WKC23776.1 3'(2'),5'-bisphosphate nucleotidase CysQ [Rhizobium sp. SSA_523]
MLEIFERAALAAGRAILEIYHRDFAVETKADQSPVTEADLCAEAIILRILQTEYPDLPAIAEEQMAAGCQPDISGGRFLLIDPLDGTREFIHRNGEFTVNIALIENNAPVAGIVYAPAIGVAYLGDQKGAWKLSVREDQTVVSRSRIQARCVASPPVAVASRSYLDAETSRYLEDLQPAECRTVGSSLKFGLVAEGLADVYPRFGRTMEWDTAAGDAVVRAAGGSVLAADGKPLTYGKCGRAEAADFANGAFFVWGSRDAPQAA